MLSMLQFRQFVGSLFVREIHDPLKRLAVLLTKLILLLTLLLTRLFQCGKRAGAELARDP